VVADSTTVNLYRVASAALDDRPDRRVIVADRADFPTDRYVVEGLARARNLEVRWLDGDPVEGLAAEDVARALGGDVALVVLSLVSYRSAAIVELETSRLPRATRAPSCGLSHAAGRDPRRAARRDVGLAVGCSYKFLFGGPGAPAWLYVAPRLQAARPPIQGWFARADQFAMGDGFVPRDGIAGWLTGTPSILAMVAVEEGVALVAEAGSTRSGRSRQASRPTPSTALMRTSHSSAARSAARGPTIVAARTSRSAIRTHGA
jgi:kynureninase